MSTTVIMHTSEGDITINLFDDLAPETVANFVGLATGEKTWRDPMTGEERNEPFYDGLTFHRIIKDFMIQGGCPLGTGTGGPGYDFDDEIVPTLTFDHPYLLAMANAGLRRGMDGKIHGTPVPAGHGERRPAPRHGRQDPRHQRLAVLHHHRADTVAQRPSHDLR